MSSFRVTFLPASRTLSSKSLVSFIGCNSVNRGGSAFVHHAALLLSMATSRTSVSSILALERKHIISTRYFSDVHCLLQCLITSANALCHPYSTCFCTIRRCTKIPRSQHKLLLQSQYTITSSPSTFFTTISR